MRILITLFLLLATAPAMAAPSVKLTSESTVNAPVIRLGDVAVLRGFDAKSKKRLSRVALGRAPMVGLMKHVPRAYIERRIKDVFSGRVTVKGPARLAVKREGSVLSGKSLLTLIRSSVEARIPYDLGEVANIKLPKIPDVRVPAGSKARVTFADGEDFDGPTTAELIIEDGANRVSTRRVSITVDRFVDAFGVRRTRKRGDVLQKADIVAIRVAASTLPSDAVKRPEFVAGAELRRRAKVGEPLRLAWVKIPPVITRGERVRLVARRGGIQLTTTGQALNNASFGSFVRVRNLDSRKIVTGRAHAPGVVELEF